MNGDLVTSCIPCQLAKNAQVLSRKWIFDS